MQKKSKEEFLRKLRGGTDNPTIKQILYIPLKLWNEYLTYATYWAGKTPESDEHPNICKVMEKGLELIKKEEAREKTEYDNRLTMLEDRVQKLEKTKYVDKERPKTFAD